MLFGCVSIGGGGFDDCGRDEKYENGTCVACPVCPPGLGLVKVSSG